MTALRRYGLLFPLLLVTSACGGSASPEAKEAAPAVPGRPGPTAPAPTSTVPAPIATPPSGMRLGATPYEGGVEFRVWAPNAKSVALVGEAAQDDKNASVTRRILTAEPATRTFALRVDGAKPGQRYQYAITKADGAEVQRADPRARASDGAQSVVIDPRSYVWKTKSFAPPAREAAVVYELHVGSFSVPAGKSTGTFTSSIDRLDTLADLGVNVVELMPIHGHGAPGWGYGPQQWFAPQAEYGSPDELRAFVDAAHARGIAVILDVVFNHYDNYANAPLRCFDGACPNGSAGVYFFDQEPYRATPWGPRPSYATKEVADFFADNVFAWTTEYGVDGFRHDSVSNIRALDGKGAVPGGVEILKRMNQITEAARPGALLVAEDLKGEATVSAASSAGGLGFVSQWDGGFGWAVTSALSAATDTDRDIGSVRNTLTSNYNGDPFQRLLFVETHDSAGNDGARLPVRFDASNPSSLGARKRSLLAAGLLLTAPGIPMLFMGQEMLEDTKFEPQPAPLDWGKATRNAPIVAFYKDMIRLRRNLDGASGGLGGKNVAVTHLNDSGANKVVAFRRWGAGNDDVMVIANFGATRYVRYDVGVPSAGTWTARVDSDTKKYGADFGRASVTAVDVVPQSRDGLPATASVALGPYSMVVLTR